MTGFLTTGSTSRQARLETVTPAVNVRPGRTQGPPKTGRGSATPSAQEPATSQQPKATPTQEDLQKIASAIQQKFSAVSTDLEFSVDSESGKSIVTMTDKHTKEVVWQFPSEEAMKLAKAMDQYQKGQVISRKA